MPVSAFVDPRTDPAPEPVRPSARLAEQSDDLLELCRLCREGRLYEVERWIQGGRPVQLAKGTARSGRRWHSPLRIALDSGNHALVLLLLSNGYDPNRENRSPLNLALRSRRWDLVDLLLAWGADPHRVDLEELFGTYRSDLFERFRRLGVDLVAGHAIAHTLADHTSNKPLLGFARRHREEDPRIQTDLNIALVHHAEEGNEKGMLLCLWAGADPHASAPSLRWGLPKEGRADDEDLDGASAVEEACRRGNVRIVERLGPDPERDDFDELYKAASTASVLDLLARHVPPRDGSAVLRDHLWWATFDWGFGHGTGRSLSTVRHLFELGVRWEGSSKDEIAEVRRWLLKSSRYTFVEAMKLLATKDYCEPEILAELGRTAAMRRKMKEVGFLASDETDRSRYRSFRERPTGSLRVRRKFGVEPPTRPESERPLPRIIYLGRSQPGGREVRMTRAELFERVWSSPASTLADAWGLSDTGIRKACRRLKVPTPGRGYWQKAHAGKRVRRPKLPKLPEGEAEEIVIRA